MSMSNKNTPFPQSGEPKARDQQKVKLDLSLGKDVKCENVINGEVCNNYTFTQVVLFKHFSAIASQTGEEGMLPINSYACNVCGWVNRQFLPAGFFPDSPKVQAPTATSDKP